MLSTLKERWNKLFVFAASLMAILSAFIIPPPYGIDKQGWYKYGVFLVALASGLWLVPIHAWSRRTHSWRWWCAATVISCLSIPAFLHYTSLIDQWTVPFWNQRVVVGSVLTEDARAYKATLIEQNRPSDDLSLLGLYGGRTSDIWEQRSISEREHLGRVHTNDM